MPLSGRDRKGEDQMKKLFSILLAVVMLGSAAISASAAGDHMYLIKDSDRRELTREELWQWDYESLGYILNEIFARHGYVFSSGGKYDNYFSSMPWYKPNPNWRKDSPMNKTEWNNEALVKEVRQEMRATKNYNKGGKNVWSYYSSGFDTIQGFDYVEFKTSQKLAVYSAPSEASWRGANGKAVVSANGAVFSDGTEKGWLLVMYETNNGGVRVGYIDKSKVRGKVEGDVYNAELAFGYLPATVTESCTLTDDPSRQSSVIMTLNSGDKVTFLTNYFDRTSWAYIETTTPDGLVCRGFIPAGALDTGMTDQDTIGEGIEGEG